MKNLKMTLFLGACSLLVSCGNNAAPEPNLQPAEAARSNNFTDYNDQGQAVNYRVCPDNPNQYCARQCSASCQAQPTTVMQTVREVRITRYFVVLQNPLPNPRTCSNQITYDRAGSCEGDNENVVLGSLHVVSPDAGVIHVEWNNNLSERSFDTNQPVAYYRLIAHGLMDLSSSWVSDPIIPNPGLPTVEVTIDRNSIGSATNYAGKKFNPVYNPANPVGLNSSGQPLASRVPLTENAPYWYEVVAYNSDDTPFLGHLQQPITRTFDFVQTNCGGVIVAGFCSLQ